MFRTTYIIMLTDEFKTTKKLLKGETILNHCEEYDD